MDEQVITLPRSVVEQLVDPDLAYYIDSEWANCQHCDGWPDRSNTTPDQIEHAADCPVRIAQEALKEQTNG